MADAQPIPTHKLFKDLTGMTFGRWMAIGLGGRKNNAYYWICRCECGIVREVNGNSLRHGLSVSCGCYKDECTSQRRRTHGMSTTSEYRIYQAMIDRCINPNCTRYPWYGAKGIRVCDRWMESFENFFADMGPRPSKDHSIDRIKGTDDYEPSNCRWATLIQQRNNQSNNHPLTFNGKTQTIAAWERELGFKPGVVKARINRYKWSIDRALTTPA